jgi:SNF2 family DNA or RNA helicase
MKNFQPHNYQQDAINHIINNPYAGLFLPMGLGKTASVLSAIKAIKAKGEIDRFLIIAPIRVCKLVWPLEIQKWADFNALTISIAHGKNKKEALESGSDILLINPEGLPWLARTILNKEFTFKGKRWMLIVDESSNFKNATSQRFKILKKLLDNFQRRVILTGTPAPNGLMQLWSQLFLLDKGKRLGKSFSDYKRRYFYQADYMGYVWEPHDWSEDAIYKKVNDIVVHKSVNELDLPERIDNYIEFELKEEWQFLYNKMKKDMIIQLKDQEFVSVNAAVVVNKLKQICNGGLYNEDGDIVHIHDQKTEVCQEIVNSLGGKPCLIFYEYEHDLKRLKNTFKNAKVLGQSEECLEELINKWNQNRILILLVQVSRGSHGLNLQDADCHDVIWYSLPYDLELYLQACARVHRQGVKHPVKIHHIVTKGTIDEKIINVLNNKNKTQNRLLENLIF